MKQILKIKNWLRRNQLIKVAMSKAWQLRVMQGAPTTDLPALEKAAYNFSDVQMEITIEKLDEALAQETSKSQHVSNLEKEKSKAMKNQDYETAAQIRDAIKKLKNH